MPKTGDIRKHDPTLFVSPMSIGARGFCSIHNYKRGPCEPPVIDYYTERRKHFSKLGYVVAGGFWKALCRYHANMKRVSDDEIAKVVG